MKTLQEIQKKLNLNDEDAMDVGLVLDAFIIWYSECDIKSIRHKGITYATVTFECKHYIIFKNREDAISLRKTEICNMSEDELCGIFSGETLIKIASQFIRSQGEKSNELNKLFDIEPIRAYSAESDREYYCEYCSEEMEEELGFVPGVIYCQD